MAKLVFRLNHVPEIEAAQVRELLDEHEIDYYETESGRWGFSVAGIWIKNNEDFARTRALIDAFQLEYSQKARAQYEQDKLDGKIPTFWQLLKQNPTTVILYWILIGFILFISTVPIIRYFYYAPLN